MSAAAGGAPSPSAPVEEEWAPLRRLRRPARVFVLAFLALTLWVRVLNLVPEVANPHGMLNDMVLHDAAIRASARAMERGDGPLDGWLGAVSVGYPFLRQYQPASHVLAATILRAVGEDRTDASRVRAWLTAITMTLFPLAVYRAARDFGLGRVGAAVAAAVSPLIEAPLLLGLTDQAYLWRGFGLYSQCLGTIPFVLGIGRATRALETGKGLVSAGLLVGATLFTHFIYGWLAALIVGAIAVCATPAPVPAPEVRTIASIVRRITGNFLMRLGRLAVIGAVAAGASAFILLPAVRTAQYANHSAIEPTEKWDGYGPEQLSKWTAEGRMFDGDAGEMRAKRFPVVTILTALGLMLALARIPPLARATGVDALVPGRTALRIGVMLLLSAALLSGRVTWVGEYHVGRFVDWVPGAKYLHLQRMIAGVHLAAMLLAGLVAHAVAATLARVAPAQEGGAPGDEAGRVRRAEPPVVSLAACGLFFAVVLLPAVVERIEFCRVNGDSAFYAEHGSWTPEGKRLEMGATDPELLDLVDQASRLAPGRIYAGHARAERFVKKLAQGVPLDAVCTANDLDTLGHLWHPFALASDLAYFKFNAQDALDAQTFAVSRFLLPDTAPVPPYATRVTATAGIVLYERADVGWFSLVSAPSRVEVDLRKSDIDWKESYNAVERWYGSRPRKLGVAPLLALAGEQWEPAGPADRTPRGSILESSVADDRFGASFELEEPGYVCAKIAYHPALAATLDGEPAPVACVMPGFAAVRVGAPGKHEVLLRVAPDRWRPWLLLGGLLLIAGIAFALAWTPLGALLGPAPPPPPAPPPSAPPPAPPVPPEDAAPSLPGTP